jgi:tetratricopeptide (TPR) repeat protein
MRYVNGQLLIAHLAGLAIALWSTPALPDSNLSIFRSEDHCGDRMSCMTETPKMSIIVADAPKMSLASPTDDPGLSDCTGQFMSRHIKETIKICEGYLDKNTGTVRDRATAMYVLGQAYSRSGEAFTHDGKVSETRPIQLWKKAAKLDPTYIEPFLSMGNLFGLSTENDQAEAAFGSAQNIDPKDWRVYTGRANAIFNTHRGIKSRAALAAAEKAAAIKPDEPMVRMVYGRMLQLNYRYEEAAKQYEAAVGKYDPTKDTSLELMREPDPLQSLAYVYNKMGKPALAAVTLSKYMDSIPVANCDYSIFQERAEYYELAGNLAKAAADFKEASLRAPPEYSTDLKAKQAMLLARAGAKSEAGEEIRSVLARGSLRPTLKVQVFLRNQGYDEVTINGKYDAATKRALDACLLDKECAPGIGQAI